MEFLFFSDLPGWLKVLLLTLLAIGYVWGQLEALRAAGRAWERRAARKRREQWTKLLKTRNYMRYWMHDTKELVVALEQRGTAYRVLTLKYSYGERDQTIDLDGYATEKEALDAYHARIEALKAEHPA